ncbi:MAG: hydantoinase/oxoprolinase family protein [Actinobacteria bacterium]|nr:hydantoinase/oxoprolinase family protein [Actinomycetota bacterium]MBU2688541.1 hydantoinase/oxoprolinase family protein [Actinomycetota bacterium]
MALTIDVDTGGTFTDGFFTRDGEFRMVKVETTPHDLTMCFMSCIDEGARALGFGSSEQMLVRADAVKFSTTVATNTMIQRSGPKLGVIVTKGHERDLYADGNGDDGDTGGLPLASLIRENMIAGVSAGSDAAGITVEPDQDEVRAVVGRLLTSGARAIVVCLRGSFDDPAAERKIKEIIQCDYPRQYLGAVPVFLSSELCARDGDHLRLNSTAVNAYLHRELARYLYKAEEDLRQSKYRKPLLIVHSTGGAARVAKTTALHTYNSGPVAGFLGSLSVARLYGLQNVCSVDMGGTSTDVGVIARDRYGWEFTPRVGEIPVNVPMIQIAAIGGGGGSLASVDGEGGLRVGPESAGALPGPACYGLGGDEATVTDADLVLGFLNPDRFLGGRRKLDVEKATEAIGVKVAGPLGLGVEEAALLIKDKVDSMVAEALEAQISEKGLDPSGFTLFVYGGAGSTHCCGFGAGFARLMVFPYSPVFSAFGASTLDVMHAYERVRDVTLCDSDGSITPDLDDFNGPVKEMTDVAWRDLRGEGFPLDGATLELELEASLEDGTVKVLSPYLLLEGEDQAREVCEAVHREAALRSGGEEATGGRVLVRAFRLTARSPVEHVGFARLEPEGEDPVAALTGTRPVCWGGTPAETRVFDRGLLRCGNVVTGPAVIEQDDTTCVLPEGRKLTIDACGNGAIENA